MRRLVLLFVVGVAVGAAIAFRPPNPSRAG
jgi:hypothetical protein